MVQFSERGVLDATRAVLQEAGVLGLVAVILALAMAARYYSYGVEANSGSTILLGPLIFCLVRIGVLNGMKIQLGQSAGKSLPPEESTGVARRG